jgi:hypothetical protein
VQTETCRSLYWSLADFLQPKKDPERFPRPRWPRGTSIKETDNEDNEDNEDVTANKLILTVLGFADHHRPSQKQDLNDEKQEIHKSNSAAQSEPTIRRYPLFLLQRDNKEDDHRYTPLAVIGLCESILTRSDASSQV